MRVLKGATLCSGIGAPECAAPDIDWIWSSDIEPFPNAVRAARYPESINLGDMTAPDFVERAAAVGLPDVLVAGTPCQAFSVAGLRQSLADDRGNLTLLFVRICDAVDLLRRAAGLPPLWIVWENVPGVLSVKDNAFGSLLAGLGGHDAPIVPGGRGRWTNAGVVAGPQRTVAWRILDAQHVGVAQRRRRVFVVARGNAGNWDSANALLPLIESLRWHPALSRKTGKDVAGSLTSRASGGGGGPGAGTDEACAGYLQAVGWPAQIAPTLNAAFGTKQGLEDQHALGGAGLFVPTLTTQCGTATEDGTGRGSPLVATPINTQLGLRGPDSANSSREGIGVGEPGDPAYTLQSAHSHAVATLAAVRRLTPRECERLQGFPDDWTAITVKGKPAADAPRYKALGNSMAVPVMRYILDRLKAVDGGSQ